MKIHEYQAKAILARYGVRVPSGEAVFKASDARGVAERLGGGTVVKAQIHAGGRGKGGGVKLAANPAEAERLANQILGMNLVTHQTGPEGRVVSRLLVEQGLPIARELYLGLVIDRAAGRPVFMASQDGGMEIETVAEKTPDRIFKEYVNPAAGLIPFQTRKLAFALGLQGDRLSAVGPLEIWSKPLSDGSKAVALFNRGELETSITLKMSDVNLGTAVKLHDVWGDKDITVLNGTYTAVVPKHGVVFLRIRNNS